MFKLHDLLNVTGDLLAINEGILRREHGSVEHVREQACVVVPLNEFPHLTNDVMFIFAENPVDDRPIEIGIAAGLLFLGIGSDVLELGQFNQDSSYLLHVIHVSTQKGRFVVDSIVHVRGNEEQPLYMILALRGELLRKMLRKHLLPVFDVKLKMGDPLNPEATTEVVEDARVRVHHVHVDHRR